MSHEEQQILDICRCHIRLYLSLRQSAAAIREGGLDCQRTSFESLASHARRARYSASRQSDLVTVIAEAMSLAVHDGLTSGGVLMAVTDFLRQSMGLPELVTPEQMALELDSLKRE